MGHGSAIPVLDRLHLPPPRLAFIVETLLVGLVVVVVSG